jgi:hypothetical protein
MLSISEICRIYCLRSLKKHWMCHISYLHNTEIYFFHTFHCYFSCFTTEIERKSQSFLKSLKKYTSSYLEVEVSTFVPCERHWLWYRITHCQLKYTGCGTVWNIARWNTLDVVPYDILLGCTGRGTAWHIARWKALVVVPHHLSVLPSVCPSVRTR